MRNLLALILSIFLMLLVINPSYAGEWYEGGNLHQASVETWKQSSYKNRLATSADWFVSITKSKNPSLQRKLDGLSASEYLSALKSFSGQLEKCITDTVNINSEGKGFTNNGDRIAETASICYISMYGIQ